MKILKVKGLILGKWLKFSFKIDRGILETKLKDDGDLFGYSDVDSYLDNNNYKDNLELLKRFPDYITPVDGGRLDIVIRTPPEVLSDLEGYRMEYDNLNLLERLVKVLKNIEKYPKIEEYISMAVNIHSIGEALDILNRERI